jgi:hypothetical protein
LVEAVEDQGLSGGITGINKLFPGVRKQAVSGVRKNLERPFQNSARATRSDIAGGAANRYDFFESAFCYLEPKMSVDPPAKLGTPVASGPRS